MEFNKIAKSELIARLEILTAEVEKLQEQARKAQAVSHELYVHKIELEVQNHELQEAQ